MEYEVEVKSGFERHFKDVLEAFDKDAKILSMTQNFKVETSTSQLDIESWTMVIKVIAKRPELIVVADPSYLSSNGWVTSIMPNNGNNVQNANGNNGGSMMGGLTMSGNMGLSITTPIFSFMSLLSYYSMCNDLTLIHVNDRANNLTRSLLKLITTPAKIEIYVPISAAPSVVTLGDFRALYSSVSMLVPIFFDDRQNPPYPIQSSHLSRSPLGTDNIILEI